MTEYEIFRTAINSFGEREQSAMAMEECGELIRAVNKMHRDPNAKHREELIGEIADVLIMIDQLTIIYGLGITHIEEARAEKVKRLEDMLIERHFLNRNEQTGEVSE